MQTHDGGAERSRQSLGKDTVRCFLPCDPVACLESGNAHRIKKIRIGFDLIDVSIAQLDAVLELRLGKPHLSELKPGGYITGSSDANPVEAQIDLIKECIPDADKIGILYTQSETNSEVQANQAQAQAEKVGLTVVRMTCTDTTDLPSGYDDREHRCQVCRL